MHKRLTGIKDDGCNVGDLKVANELEYKEGVQGE